MDAEDLDLDEERRPDGTVCLTLRGELDLVSGPALVERLDALQGDCTLLRVNLRGLTFMDSTGVGILLAAARRAEEEGTGLQLVRPDSGEVWRVIELTALDKVLPFVSDES